jgi:hypothetical protein
MGNNLGLDPGRLFEVVCVVRRSFQVNSGMLRRLGNYMPLSLYGEQLLWILPRPWQGHYLHKTTQTHNKSTQTAMPREGFEPTMTLFQRAKTVYALDFMATVIG